MEEEMGGFDNMASWAIAVAQNNRAANPQSDSLKVYDYAVIWHLLTGTPYATMEAEMKTLRFRSKDRYLDRVIMPRFLQAGREQQQAIDESVEATLSTPLVNRGIHEVHRIGIDARATP